MLNSTNVQVQCIQSSVRKWIPTKWITRSNGYHLSISSYTQRKVQNMDKWILRLTHKHTRLTALCPGLPGWAGTRKVKPIWILLKQETASGSGISWDICKSAPRSRQMTTTAPHRSVFYRPDAIPAAQPTASKHWRPKWTGYSWSSSSAIST